AALRAAIIPLCVGRTTITITHRLEGIAPTDRVVVLDRGRVVEDGPFSVLEGAGGTVTRLRNLQDRCVQI
ncbi:MAG: thiol reductant ABC exporter subunit CydC, partial [Acidiphilium sp.]|nr:thiol reductant ABC exporter subunit CydC [Acidiphilium sp.]